MAEFLRARVFAAKYQQLVFVEIISLKKKQFLTIEKIKNQTNRPNSPFKRKGRVQLIIYDYFDIQFYDYF